MSMADCRQTAIATSPKGVPAPYEIIEKIEKLGTLPYTLTLKHPFFKNGELCFDDDFSSIKTIWNDCQLNSVLLLLCSEALRTIIDTQLTGNEGIRWISCNIIYQNEKKTYHFPLFTKILDVLDEERSFYGGREKTFSNLIKPVFAYSKIQRYSIFSLWNENGYPCKISSSVYVSENIKKAIIKAKMKKGIYFNQAPVSYE